MSTSTHHTDQVEVVHLAGYHRAGAQRCVRCHVLLVHRGRPYLPGEFVVALGAATWATTRAPTCEALPARTRQAEAR